MFIIVLLANIVAPIISMLKLFPQALKTWRERDNVKSLAGVSILTQWAVILSAVLWIMLGINLNSVTVYLPTIFQLACAVSVIVLIKLKTPIKTFLVPCSIAMFGLIAYALVFGLTDFEMLLVNIVAPILSFAMFVPQALLTWKNRNKPEYLGVSAGTQILIVFNAISWGIVGWDLGSFAVAAPGIVNLPLAIFTLIVIYRSKINPSEIIEKIETGLEDTVNIPETKKAF